MDPAPTHAITDPFPIRFFVKPTPATRNPLAPNDPRSPEIPRKTDLHDARSPLPFAPLFFCVPIV